MANKELKERGRPCAMSKEKEMELVKLCVDKYNQGNPFTISSLQTYINLTYELNISYSFVRHFLLSHRDKLKKRLAKPIEVKRKEVKQSLGKEYVTELQKVFYNVEPQLVFCMDETGIQEYVDAKKKKVICPKEVDDGNVTYNVIRDGNLVSLIGCIPLVGPSVVPMLIIKTATVQSIIFGDLLDGVDVVIKNSSKGYCTSQIFLEWLNICFIPHINRLKDEPNKKTVLIADGFRAHSGAEALHVMEQNKICIIFIPPHSSHLFSPLDLVTFSNLKNNLRKLRSLFPSRQQAHILTGIVKSYQSCTIPIINRAAFRRAGIICKNEDNKQIVSVDLFRMAQHIERMLKDEDVSQECTENEDPNKEIVEKKEENEGKKEDEKEERKEEEKKNEKEDEKEERKEEEKKHEKEDEIKYWKGWIDDHPSYVVEMLMKKRDKIKKRVEDLARIDKRKYLSKKEKDKDSSPEDDENECIFSMKRKKKGDPADRKPKRSITKRCKKSDSDSESAEDIKQFRRTRSVKTQKRIDMYFYEDSFADSSTFQDSTTTENSEDSSIEYSTSSFG
ncbi:putative DDE superfamily endonuclease [Monocercomonoides exilis]|uniref:putative DDE superfamily endonuclease n=1 Tax=Monocercomonoides exilis TaxID=2049356 RepID=UPI00355ABECB|nr:putative DDE superfamily endonuclease [Monocercomonoides exilis]|eukprot:MONOS_16097.1-p1 / transcript=MONOS_16097.1 / gene=MONOS_16097 / organism=Monocercomonoides_exilis_PA203 / gene_product=unspecified product / transcript_product=unspecified product / location=Mono_scaffold01502:3781-5463(-) / protein_length=560 / sequence_SO=supercontig / SO=protein_coding / is_pseudo=false